MLDSRRFSEQYIKPLAKSRKIVMWVSNLELDVYTIKVPVGMLSVCVTENEETHRLIVHKKKNWREDQPLPTEPNSGWTTVCSVKPNDYKGTAEEVIKALLDGIFKDFKVVTQPAYYPEPY